MAFHRIWNFVNLLYVRKILSSRWRNNLVMANHLVSVRDQTKVHICTFKTFNGLYWFELRRTKEVKCDLERTGKTCQWRLAIATDKRKEIIMNTFQMLETAGTFFSKRKCFNGYILINCSFFPRAKNRNREAK
jgi:hypothetical protein